MATNPLHSSSSLPWSRYQTAIVNRPLPRGYCLLRSNGVYTPLIPADEISSEVTMPYGYPRTILSEAEVKKWNLQCVGEYSDPQYEDIRSAPTFSPCPAMEGSAMTAPYSPSAVNDQNSSYSGINATRNHRVRDGDRDACSSSPDSYLSGTALSVISNPSIVLHRSQDVQKSQHEDNSTQRSVTSYDSRTRRPLPPSGVEPDLRKKEFCQFWIRHGQCDFMQQGCLYKHEMPPLPILKDIMGLNTFPRWWVEERIDTERGHNAPPKLNNKAQRSVPARSRNLAAIGSEREAGMFVGGLQTSKYAQRPNSAKADSSSVHLIDLDDDPSITRSSVPSNSSRALGVSTGSELGGQLVSENSRDNVTNMTVVKRFIAQNQSAQSHASRAEIAMINEKQRARAMKETKLDSTSIEELAEDTATDYSRRHPTNTCSGKARKTRRGRKFSVASKSSVSEVSTEKAPR